MSRELREAIRTELIDLQSELDAVSPLLSKLAIADPDQIELRAVAASLHAFYNGVERILLLIAKSHAEVPTQSHAWHRDLLVKMSQTGPSREPVVSQDLVDELSQYLAFRHFFRHAYPMRLRWNLVRPLVEGLTHAFSGFREAVERFCTS